MIEAFVTLWMAVTSRQSGGGLGAERLPRWLTWLPEILFAAGFGLAAFQYGGWIAAPVATAWSYIWMQTGHGAVLHWGTYPLYSLARKQTLSPIVDSLAARFGIEVGSTAYCRLFMAVKGFLIGLPVGGVPLAVLWPLGYEIGNQYKARVRPHAGLQRKGAALAELMAGAGAGLAICLVI